MAAMYAVGFLISRITCSSTNRSYQQKKGNHNSWFALGGRFNSPMCICGALHLRYFINNIIDRGMPVSS